MADLSDTSRWWFNCDLVCERVCECVCLSEDMSPYCSAHDEWLIMKLCMYVGYHDTNTFWWCPSDPIKLKKCLKKLLRCFTGTAHHSRDAATGFAAVATRPRAYCSSMEGHTRLSTALVYLKCDFSLFFYLLHALF